MRPVDLIFTVRYRRFDFGWSKIGGEEAERHPSGGFWPDTRCPQFSASDARAEGFFPLLWKKPSRGDAGVMRGFFLRQAVREGFLLATTQRTLFSINPTRLACYICIGRAA